MQVWFQLVKRGEKKTREKLTGYSSMIQGLTKKKMTRPELEPTTSEETALYQLRRI